MSLLFAYLLNCRESHKNIMLTLNKTTEQRFEVISMICLGIAMIPVIVRYSPT